MTLDLTKPLQLVDGSLTVEMIRKAFLTSPSSGGRMVISSPLMEDSEGIRSFEIRSVDGQEKFMVLVAISEV